MHKAEFTEMAQNKTISCKMLIIEFFGNITSDIKTCFCSLRT